MALIEVLKWDAAPKVFAFKYPNCELNTKSQLVVNESQEAVFVKAGLEASDQKVSDAILAVSGALDARDAAAFSAALQSLDVAYRMREECARAMTLFAMPRWHGKKNKQQPNKRKNKMNEPMATTCSEKKRGTYQLLALLLGSLGIHNFWCGRKTIAWIQLCVTIGSAILCAIGSTDVDPYDGESLGPAVWIWAVVEMFVVKYDGCHRLMK